MMIDAGLVGLIIGRKGETLKRVEEMSGARVQFVTDNTAGPERVCNITGSRAAIQSARQQISTIISENSAASIRDDRGSNPGPMGKKYGGGGGGGGGGSSSMSSGGPTQGHHPALKEGGKALFGPIFVLKKID